LAISTAFTWGTRRFYDGAGARARHGHTAAAITFDPHPMKLLRPDNAPRMIETLSQRLGDSTSWGWMPRSSCDSIERCRFYLPKDFLQRILIERCTLRRFWLVRISVLGIAGQGDVRLLAQFGKEHGSTFENRFARWRLVGIVVSSTAIRNAICRGVR